MTEAAESTIESEWFDFLGKDVAVNAPMVQIMEMKKAFYAGAASGMKLGMLRTPEVNLRELRDYVDAEDRRRGSKLW